MQTKLSPQAVKNISMDKWGRRWRAGLSEATGLSERQVSRLARKGTDNPDVLAALDKRLMGPLLIGAPHEHEFVRKSMASDLAEFLTALEAATQELGWETDEWREAVAGWLGVDAPERKVAAPVALDPPAEFSQDWLRTVCRAAFEPIFQGMNKKGWDTKLLGDYLVLQGETLGGKSQPKSAPVLTVVQPAAPERPKYWAGRRLPEGEPVPDGLVLDSARFLHERIEKKCPACDEPMLKGMICGFCERDDAYGHGEDDEAKFKAHAKALRQKKPK